MQLRGERKKNICLTPNLTCSNSITRCARVYHTLKSYNNRGGFVCVCLCVACTLVSTQLRTSEHFSIFSSHSLRVCFLLCFVAWVHNLQLHCVAFHAFEKCFLPLNVYTQSIYCIRGVRASWFCVNIMHGRLFRVSVCVFFVCMFFNALLNGIYDDHLNRYIMEYYYL